MPPQRRRPHDLAKERLWRRIIRRYQQSDLPVHVFCRNEGLKAGNFHWWRRELDRRHREKTGPLPDSSIKQPAEQPAVPALLPVRVTDAELAQSRPAPPIEIALPASPTVRVAPGSDPRTLGQVLAVLEGRPC